MLLVEFRPNGKFANHHDLFFTLGAVSLEADTYYFELDRPAGSGPDGDQAVRRSLAKLLEQWLDRIERQNDMTTVYLPFANWDQSTGIIVADRIGDELVVRSGWCGVEGWSHYPSDVADFDERCGKVNVKSDPSHRLRCAQLLDAIKESLAVVCADIG